jgi:RNA polymerase sigma-70 factor (ECF subfamily)
MTVTPLTRAYPPGDFDEFYRQYFVRVLMLIRRHFPQCDAEEIAQETMARCLAKFDEFDPHRDPWNLVASIARNAAIDSMRRNRRLVSADDVPEAPRGGEDQTYEAVLVLDQRRTVRAAMQRLRPADRQLIIDRELEDMAYTEMAELRAMTPNALRQGLFRAKGRLAVELRRAGATLGLVPVALHGKLSRLSRRCADLSGAAGPAGASALSAIAVAGVATVATVLGGPGAPAVTVAAPPPASALVVRPADRAPGLAPEGDREAAPAPRGRTVAAPRPGRPSVPPDPPSIPITIKNQGDPINNPQSPGGQGVRVPTPVGDVGVETEYENTPVLIVLCEYKVMSCPPPG